MDQKKMMGLIGAVIIIVVALILAPIVFDQVATVAGHANIADFTGAQPLARLIPLMYVVGVLAMAGMIAYTAFKAPATAPARTARRRRPRVRKRR